MNPPQRETSLSVVLYILQLSLLALAIALIVRWVEGNASSSPVIRSVEMRAPVVWIWLLLIFCSVISLVVALRQTRTNFAGGNRWIEVTQIGIAGCCLLGACILPLFVRPFASLDKPEVWGLGGPTVGLYTSSVFFGNGSATPDTTDVHRLKVRAELLASCTVLDVNVNGLVSSAEYRKDNDKNNLDLARRRVAAVKEAINWRTTPRVVPWTSLKEMSNSASFYTDRSHGVRRLDREALNRRVDVIWRVENCGIDLQEFQLP